MNEGAEEIEIWEPTDDWLASLIRTLRGMRLGEPISPGLLASWRRALREEARRVAVARARKKDPYPPRLGRAGLGEVSAAEVVRDLLRSEEGRFWIGVVLSMVPMLAGLGRASGRRPWPSGAHAGTPPTRSGWRPWRYAHTSIPSSAAPRSSTAQASLRTPCSGPPRTR
ncbi:hypothetical protein ACFQU7_08785 [Pseudoroseomonas wenyumeiae]